MDIFAEYLLEWGFDDKWRPVVQRLHDRVDTWPTDLLQPDDFTIYDAYEVSPDGRKLTPTGGLLIWVDFADAQRVIRLTLGARIDEQGLRCGPIEPSRPDDPTSTSLTWFTRPIHPGSLEQIADELLDWFALEARRWHDKQH
jgi:hypothetical protein